LGRLRFSTEAADADRHSLVDRAVSALLPLAQRGGLRWSGEGGGAALHVYGLDQWAGALAGLAPLTSYMPPVRVEVTDDRVPGPLLVQLLSSLAGLQLARLSLYHHTPGEGFWGALRQAPAGVQVLQLYCCQQLDEADFAAWLATHPHPMRLELEYPAAQAAAAVRGAQQRLAQQGLQSRVQVVVEEVVGVL
jgi:hypothetical protein